MIFDLTRFLLDLLAFYAIYSLLALSLNIEYGYAGIPNFGKAMFFAGGAFAVGAFTTRLTAVILGLSLERFKYRNILIAYQASQIFAQTPFLALSMLFFSIIVGIIFSSILGYLASYPAIKLREDYLGLTLLSAGELLRVIARNYDPLVGGSLGVAVPDFFAPLSGFTKDLTVTGFFLATALLTFIIVDRIVNSPYGRLLKAMRENELAVESYGRNIAKIRMTTLVLGSAIAGLAGVLYASYTRYVYADVFTPFETFVIWAMVIIGGKGNNAGAFIGTLVYVLIERLIMVLKHEVKIPFDVNYLGYVVLSIVLILLLFYRPKGLLPEKPVQTPNIKRIRELKKERNDKTRDGLGFQQ
ncbi:MAG: branched-chain amino acid ABC transporter permease [Thermoproteales archaeon]|nr:branched-chain amino acid ABC transporter permease [Thermoproteales archaeon]